MDFYDYQSSSFSDHNGYYYSSQIPDQDYSYYSYYPPPQQQSYSCYAYESLPTQSLVAYSPCNEVTYSIPASTDLRQYAVYHSVATPSSPDLDFVQYDPHPYKGGYDIDQTYGKPLSPSDDICYPRSSPSPTLPFPPPPILAPAPTLALVPAPTSSPAPSHEEEEEEDDIKSETHVTEEVEDQLSEDDGDDDGDGDGSEDGTNEGAIQVYQGVGEYNGGVVNQNPPGYGLEAFDLCENLFGYWPCLSKLKVSKKCDACGNERVIVADEADQWKRTADYLFGSPDPYGGWAEEGGYANVNQATYAYHHQVQCQHPAYTLYQQQPHQSSQDSWLIQQPDQSSQNSWYL